MRALVRLMTVPPEKRDDGWLEESLQAAIELEARAGSLVAKGRVALKQTDFGITPLSVLGGAIQVKDEVGVRFVIRAGALE
jgi:hypothetical protein